MVRSPPPLSRWRLTALADEVTYAIALSSGLHAWTPSIQSPPCQLAITAVAPEKRSSVARTLAPPWPGFWVADHETMRWVTSCGLQLPFMVHRVCGCVASVTSARTLELEPCMATTASCADGEPVQLADRAAQDGTETALAVGDGEGDGLGLGVGVGEVAVVCEGEPEGVVRTATLVGVPQAAMTIVAASARRPGRTRLRMAKAGGRAGVTTGRPGGTGAQE